MNHNHLIEDLYLTCKLIGKTSPKGYYQMKKGYVDTLAVRGYSFSWKCKYFFRGLVWDVFGV